MVLGGLSSSDDLGASSCTGPAKGSVGVRNCPGFLWEERTLVVDLELTIASGLVDTTDGEALSAAAGDGQAISRMASDPKEEHPFGQPKFSKP